MKTAIRVFAIVMAVMLALGAAAPLLGLRAYAAMLEIGSATSSALDVSGTPDPNYYEAKSYEIKIQTKDARTYFTMKERGSTLDYEFLEYVNTNIVRHGGLTFRKSDGTTFQPEDTFVLSIVKASTGSTNTEPTVTYTNANENGTIVKGRSHDLKFTVVDYNVKRSDVNYTNNLTSAFDGGGSFTINKSTGKDIVIRESSANQSGFAAFDVVFPVKYTGKGNLVKFDISYFDNQGEPHIVKCSANIPNTKEYVEDKDDEEEDKDTEPLTPYIIIESYSYGGNSVTAGADFTLDLLLKNTSDTHSLQNIVMNIAPQGVFSMGSSSNTIYIDDLFAGSTKRVPITINTGLTKVTDDKDANSINIKFDFQYLVEKVRKSGTSNENITIPVTFPDRFELSPPEIQDMIFTGEEAYLYMPMVNKGRSGVYNITAHIRGDMANPGQTQYIGNLNAGSESGAEFSVRFNEPGEKNGEIVVTYEDTNMNPKEVVMPFSINVQAMMEPDFPDFPGGLDPELPIDQPTDEPQKTDPKKTVVAIVAVLICGISAYTTVLKAKAKRSIFQNEEL